MTFEARFNSLGIPKTPSSFEDRFKSIGEKKPFQETPLKSSEEYKNLSLSEQMQYAQNLEKEIDYENRKGASKGILSGLSFGASEQIPGFETEGKPTEIFGQALGSLPSIELFWSRLGKPLVTLAQKSPIFGKQLGSLARILGWGGVGASESAAQSVVKGEMPNADDMIEHGVGYGILDAALQATGAGGKFISKLIGFGNKGKDVVNKVSDAIMKENITKPEEVNKLAFDILNKEKEAVKVSKVEELSKDLSERVVKPEVFKIKSESVPSQIPNPHPEVLIQDLENTPVRNKINQYAERIGSEQKLGERIQTSIESERGMAEKEYNALYKEVDDVAENITHSPETAIETATKIREELNSVKTRPEGYTKVINTLDDILEDMGNKTKVPLKTIMELGRRLNKIINYDIIGPSIKNKLKPVVSKLKNEIKLALPPEASQKYIQAEQKFGETADKFATDEMYKIRAETKPERIASLIENPSDIDSLKKTVAPEVFHEIEREILEKMDKMPFDKAKSLQREIGDKLSKEARKIADAIVESKLPLGPQAQAKRLAKGIVEDLAESFAEGKRPEKTLTLWKTPKGRAAVEKSLSSNPNKQSIIKYLEKQSLFDSLKPAIKDGHIDYKAFNDLIKDPGFIGNIRGIAGEEGVTFVRNLQKLTKNIEKNFELAAKVSKEGGKAVSPKNEKGNQILKRMVETDFPLKTKIDATLDYMGVPMTTILGLLFPYKLGIAKGVGALVGSRMFYRLISSPKARRSYIKAASLTENPLHFTSALAELSDNLNSSEDID